jgi:multimeric flavodoxin WrbA
MIRRYATLFNRLETVRQQKGRGIPQMKDIRITGIIGSPRLKKNTDALIRIYLNKLEIKPCQAHKVQDGKGCIMRDGMDAVYDIFEAADGLVLGTPVYYNSVSSQMKLMIDRSYCLAKAVPIGSGKRKYVTTVEKRKKGVVISVGGSGTNPDCVLPIFEIWSNEVNLEIIDTLCVSEGQLGKLPMENEKTIAAAFEKGRNLVRSLMQNSA